MVMMISAFCATSFAVAQALPPAVTVGLPDRTWPCWVVGTMYGSDGWRPTWGGVLNPDAPTTATALPPIVTVCSRPWSSGAEKGIGAGEGCGAPDAGLGTWWIAHWPWILSPMTRGCAIAAS